MKKGRIVQFGDGGFAYQKLLLGLFPLPEFLCEYSTGGSRWSTDKSWAKQKTLESLKEIIKRFENYKNPDKIVRVVKETELEKALE